MDSTRILLEYPGTAVHLQLQSASLTLESVRPRRALCRAVNVRPAGVH